MSIKVPMILYFSVHLSAAFNYLCSSGGNILLWIPLIWYGDRIKLVVFRALIGDPFMLVPSIYI